MNILNQNEVKLGLNACQSINKLASCPRLLMLNRSMKFHCYIIDIS